MPNDSRPVTYWETDHNFRSYDHPVARFFALQRIKELHSYLDLGRLGNALDVGCGSGLSTSYIQNGVPHVWGIDRSWHMLSQHPLRQRSRLCLSDAGKLPFADSTFDLVYAWEALHHMADPGPVVKEMGRVSRRYVLVFEPNRANPAQFLFAVFHREHRLTLRYSLRYLRSLFTSAGLRIQHAGCGGWVFPNVTPLWMLPLFRIIPYRFPFGISRWVLGVKDEDGNHP